MSDPNIYTVGWICAIPTEYVAAQAFLDSDKDRLTGDKLRPAFVHKNDNNKYTLGRIGEHNVVIAVLPEGQYGTTSAAVVPRDMLHSFPNIRIALMVGIGGGAPTKKNDVRLGDIVVSAPHGGYGGVFQYDFGKTIQDREFQATRFLDQPPTVLGTAVSGLMAEYELEGHEIQKSIEEALQRRPRLRQKYDQPDLITDRLYRADVIHPPEAEGECMTSCGSDASLLVARRGREEREDNPTVHHGLIASANQLMKDAVLRDKLALEKDVLCFEMEAAGLMNHFPCLVIRGICDYSDTHKNKQWQGYAAMAAAAYARDVLNIIPQNKVEAEMRLSELLSESHLSEAKTLVEEMQAYGYHDKVRNWLGAPDPSTNFNKAREQHHKGTGQWLLDSEVYTRWKTANKSFLWLCGIPGCGKTILSSSIIADLERSRGSAETLLYFYFDFNDVDKQTLDKAVRSLIDQLYLNVENARKEADDFYSSCEDGYVKPDQESWFELLQNMLKCQYDREFWIVLDALDECNARNEGAASGLMSYINSLRDCTANVHLLVTSRPEHDIQSAVKSWAHDSEIIPLQSADVKDDINLYIRAKVSQLSRWQKRPGIQNDIITVLSDKANGVFRWVSCQLDALSRCLDPDSIHRELASLPRTLDETYERILQTVDPSRRGSAIRLLQFLTHSKRPLRLAEAVDALAVKTSKEPRFDPGYRMPCPEEIVAYCSSLAVLVPRKVSSWDTEKQERVEEDIVEIQLAHFSVQEYLTSDRLQGDIAFEFNSSTAKIALTTVCLSYLLSLDHSGEPKAAVKAFPLAKYSAQYWPTYAAAVEKEAGRTIPIVLEYFSSTPAINFSCRIYDPDSRWSGYSNGPNEYPSGLYYASLMGLTYSVKALVDKNANINAHGGSYVDPLGAAFYNGHHEIVEILVNKGAKINGQTHEHLEALGNAVRQENQEHLQILVDHGYDAQESFSCALTTASMVGNEGIVRRLLDHGADVNWRDDDNEIPLHRASAKGHHKIVQLLLDRGAEVNAQGDYYGDVLRAALEVEHPDIVQALISKGAVIDLHDEDGSPLHIASSKGYQEIVQILIDNEADVNAEDVLGISVLEAAADKGYLEIVQLLISNGANVNYPEERRHTALQIASRSGHEVVVDMLLCNGADVYAQGTMFGTALDGASGKGHEAIVRKLLDQRSDVNNEGGYFESALYAASIGGQEAIVKILLDRDTVIDVKHWAFMSALTCASRQGHEAIVGMLLDRGAGVDVDSEPYGNALRAASARGYSKIVQLLRNKGAVLDTSGDQTMTKEESQDGTGKALSITKSPKILSQDNAILEFVSNVLTQVRFEDLSDQAVSAMFGALPQLLEAFADRVGYRPTSWGWEVRYYFHKYLDEIGQCFHDLCDKNYVKPARLESLTGSSDETRPIEKMDSRNKRKAHVAFDGDEELLPSDENREPIEAGKRPIHFQKVAAEEDNTRLLNHLHRIFELPVYRWFCQDLQKQARLSQLTDPSESFKAKIMAELPTDRLSTQRHTEPSEVLLHLDWNPSEFLSQQGYMGDKDEAIERAITLTGWLQEAQATTCADYVKQVWPTIGEEILRLVKEIVMTDAGTHAEVTLEDTTRVEACIMENQVRVKVLGPNVSIAEVGEMFAWMGAALRSSRHASGITSLVPNLKHSVVSSSHQDLTMITARSLQFRICFEFQEQTNLDAHADGCCWLGLFRNHILVTGFPIARRSSPVPGLDIPLNVITELLDVTTATTFGSTLCIKGFATLLAAQKRVGDIIIWHALYSDDDRRISYLDERLCRTPDDVKPHDLVQYRHVVGWCLKVNTHIGDPDAGHNIEWSGLELTNGFLQNIEIMRYPLRSVGPRPLVGSRDVKTSYFRQVKEFSNTSVVLYDVSTKRAWLTDGASALLHLLRKSLEWEMKGEVGDRFRLKKGILNETDRSEGFPPKAASLRFLLNSDNIPQKLFQLDEELYGSSETFGDRVTRIWSLLDQIRDLQSLEATRSTREPRSKLEGFDFMDIATLSDNFKPCMADITAKGMTWIDWMKEARALILFGNDFGELVRPVDESSICPSWVTVPTGHEYLTAHVSDIKLFLKKRNSLDQPKHRQITESLLWHSPYRPLPRCRVSETETCSKKCDMTQVLVDKTLAGKSWQTIECLQQIGDDGAFIFGFSDSYPIRWGNFGDPVYGFLRPTNIDNRHANPGQDSAPGFETMEERDRNTTSFLRSAHSDSNLTPSFKVDTATESRTRSSKVVSQSTAVVSTTAFNNPEIHEKLLPESSSKLKIAIICALPLEANAVIGVFDGVLKISGPPNGRDANDKNAYSFGVIGRHNIVVVHMGNYGKLRSAGAANELSLSFPDMELALVVGVCGAVPLPKGREPIVLGDVIISTEVVQHDLGQRNRAGFEQKKNDRTSRLFPSKQLENLLAKMRTESEWRELEHKTASYLATNHRRPEFVESHQHIPQHGRFHTAYRHSPTTKACREAGCNNTPNPAVHFGPVGSGDTVLKCEEERDVMAQRLGIIGIEMEGIGVWESFNHCLVIKGACDYADSSKNKEWQRYAAATAAACAKAFLLRYWE